MSYDVAKKLAHVLYSLLGETSLERGPLRKSISRSELKGSSAARRVRRSRQTGDKMTSKSLFKVSGISHKLFGAGVALVALIAGVTYAAQMPSSFFDPEQPQRVPAVYEKAYIPQGYDNNDIVEVVLEGMFSSACWRPADIKVEVDHDRRKVLVGPAAYQYPGLCAQMVMRFDRVVPIGVLRSGVYDLVQATDGRKLGEIPVAVATTEEPDDYLYAPVEQAFFRDQGRSGQLIIAGHFPNDCWILDEVRVRVGDDVIVVQPIAKIERRRTCQEGSYPFHNISMIDFVQKGRYLLHVRSANAKSVNSMVEMQ